MVGGLVEDEHIEVADERCCKRRAALLATGQLAHRGVEPERRDAEAIEHGADPGVGGPFVCFEAERADDVIGYGGVVVEVGILCHHSQAEVLHVAYAPGVGRELAGEDVNERGFSATVEPHDADAVTGIKPEGDSIEESFQPKGLRDFFHVDEVDHASS